MKNSVFFFTVLFTNLLLSLIEIMLFNIGREAVKRLNSSTCLTRTVPLMQLKNQMGRQNVISKRYISFSKVHLTHYLEDYYTTSEVATNMLSPMSEYIWWGWLFLQGFIVFGTLFHSNYYFTGKALPKPQGNSQLCEDSW